MTSGALLRRVLAGTGVTVAAYGAWLLAGAAGPAALVELGLWLAAGVVLHDLVLAPVATGLGAIGRRWLPKPAVVPALAALVVIGSVTLVAVPVLSGRGGSPDNPTLLDRDYTGGWLLVTGSVLLTATAVWAVRAALGARAARVGGAAAPPPPTYAPGDPPED